MTCEDFNRMIEHCVKQYDIKDTDAVYVCMQWYDNDKLYPIFFWDFNRKDNIIYVISGRDTLTYNECCGPQPIWINKDGYREKDIVNKTWTLSELTKTISELTKTLSELTNWINSEVKNAQVKFLISTCPQNIIGEINPHRTYMVKNTDGDSILVFCWDSRDSGEGPSNDAEFTFSRVRDFGRPKTSSHCICDSGELLPTP